MAKLVDRGHELVQRCARCTGRALIQTSVSRGNRGGGGGGGGEEEEDEGKEEVGKTKTSWWWWRWRQVVTQ